MGLECFFKGHDYSQDCERCARCQEKRTNSHDWFVPESDPARHHCSRCRSYGPSILELWQTCACPHCKRVRETRVGDLVERISSANGKYYEKIRHAGGVWRYVEDPGEAGTALAVLVHCLEVRAGEIDDVVLELVAGLGIVFINVQYACNDPTTREQVDCSQAVQLARQELVRRHGEAVLDRLGAPAGAGTEAPGFGQPVARWTSPGGGEVRDWPGAMLAGGSPRREQPAPMGGSIRVKRIDGVDGKGPSLTLCRSGRGVYWRGAYGGPLTYIDLETGSATSVIDEVGLFLPLDDEKLAAVDSASDLHFCDAGEPLSVFEPDAEPGPLTNGMLWITRGGNLDLIASTGPVGSLECEGTDSYVRWAHPTRNVCLLAHRSADKRDPTPWWERPTWYELLEFDESLGECESRMILSDGDDHEYGGVVLGRDDELFYVEFPRQGGMAASMHALIHRLDLRTLTSEPVFAEPRSVTHLQAGADGRLLWVERDTNDRARLMYCVPGGGSPSPLLELPHTPHWLDVDDRWTRLVYYREFDGSSELYNAALVPEVEPLSSVITGG